ncbi:MAG: hypothetical protein OEU26_11035 [Candidatus Tectomicrobia bacterium]|nr:hypothetical protein [Candidatus Tectomicrobia bacterium]
MRHACLLLFVSVLLSLPACRPKPLEDALKGRLPPEDNNRVITEYCQSCHIHRAFDDLGHVPRMQALYDRSPYTEATQCRTCHLVHKNTWGDRRRKTIWPAEVAKGTASNSSGLGWFKRIFKN